MGRRSRRRGPVAPPPAAPRRRTTRPALEDRPKAPWHPFPLVEISALIALVLLAVGLFDLDSDRGRVLVVCGLALGSLAGLDTTLREHVSGHRSHTMVLAAVPAVAAAGILYFARAPWPLVVAAAVALFAAAVVPLRRAFRRRSQA
jgi:hypothetical protein